MPLLEDVPHHRSMTRATLSTRSPWRTWGGRSARRSRSHAGSPTLRGSTSTAWSVEVDRMSRAEALYAQYQADPESLAELEFLYTEGKLNEATYK